MSLVLIFHYLLLNMFRMLVHPSSRACDLLWKLGHYGIKCWDDEKGCERKLFWYSVEHLPARD